MNNTLGFKRERRYLALQIAVGSFLGFAVLLILAVLVVAKYGTHQNQLVAAFVLPALLYLTSGLFIWKILPKSDTEEVQGYTYKGRMILQALGGWLYLVVGFWFEKI